MKNTQIPFNWFIWFKITSKHLPTLCSVFSVFCSNKFYVFFFLFFICLAFWNRIHHSGLKTKWIFMVRLTPAVETFNTELLYVTILIIFVPLHIAHNNNTNTTTTTTISNNECVILVYSVITESFGITHECRA